MLLFLLLILLLSITVMCFLFLSLSSNKQIDTDKQQREALYLMQKKEIEEELRQQNITQDEYKERINSINKQLYLDLQKNTDNIDQHPESNKLFNVLIIILIPVVAGLIYISIGGGSESLQSTIPSAADIKENPEELLQAFEKKMYEQGGSSEEWSLLAKVYLERKQFTKAKDAYNRALQQTPDAPGVQVDYIELLMLENNGTPTTESSKRIDSLLDAYPDHPKLLWLAAIDASYKNDTQLQLRYLTRLADLMPVDAPERETVEKIIEATVQNNFDSNVKMDIRITLADDLKQYITDTSVLFVYAKEINGRPMPLAVYKGDPKNIPPIVTLDDSMSMLATNKLSSQDEVNIIALISHSGTAQAKPGDLRGNINSVQVNAKDIIQLTIDQIVSD